jgi:hypothetical protein
VLVLADKKDITLRSASADPARVMLSGQGWDSGTNRDDILHIAHCEGVTIADLTFTDCRSDGIIRNNFIAGGPDCGIELWYAEHCQVYNNSIWRPEQNWGRGIRLGTGTRDTDIANNLVHGEIWLEGGEARLNHNLCARLDSYFTDPGAGDLSLTAAATGAIDQGVTLSEVPDDIGLYPRRGPVDLGAWEFSTENRNHD